MSQPNSDEMTTVPPADADAVIAQSLEPLLDLGLPRDSKLGEKIRPLARERLMELDPRGAAERMLAVQMIAAFSRSMFLAKNANHQKNTKWFALYSGECDRAMAQFRRQLQTLKDLRHPRRSSFTAIRQANIAGQQIVVTDPRRLSQPPQMSNGASNVATHTLINPDEKPPQETQAALPPEQNRPNRLARQRPKEPPLGA